MSKTRTYHQARDQEDLGLKSKPKSTINGRDDIRIRKINNQIINSFCKKDNRDQFTEALEEFESQQLSHNNNRRTDTYLP